MERGRGNEEEAEYLMGNSFLMLVLTGAVLMVAGLLFYKPVLYLFGASDATFVYAGSYIRIYLLGTLFVMISVGMNPFINSQGFGDSYTSNNHGKPFTDPAYQQFSEQNDHQRSCIQTDPLPDSIKEMQSENQKSDQNKGSSDKRK